MKVRVRVSYRKRNITARIWPGLKKKQAVLNPEGADFQSAPHTCQQSACQRGHKRGPPAEADCWVIRGNTWTCETKVHFKTEV